MRDLFCARDNDNPNSNKKDKRNIQEDYKTNSTRRCLHLAFQPGKGLQTALDHKIDRILALHSLVTAVMVCRRPGHAGRGPRTGQRPVRRKEIQYIQKHQEKVEAQNPGPLPTFGVALDRWVPSPWAGRSLCVRSRGRTPRINLRTSPIPVLRNKSALTQVAVHYFWRMT